MTKEGGRRHLSAREGAWGGETSAAEAAVVEEGLFLGRGGAAQGGVAVGEAAEADDDVAVEAAPFLELGVAGDQGHVAVLILKPFGMFEGEEEEVLQFRRDPEMVAARHGLVREHQGQRIGGELVRRAAETVPRILIEQDQEGEGGLRRLDPVVALAPGGGQVQIMAPRAKRGVESLVLGEPLVGTGRFPEGDDVGWGYEGGHDTDLSQSVARLP